MSNVITLPPIQMEALNFYQGWYESPIVTNRKTFLPAVIVRQDTDLDSLNIEPNTVILRMIETQEGS